MKKTLMMRAEVPPDVERITFDSLNDPLRPCDDMWTWLFCHLCDFLDIEEGEIWHYNGGPRETWYTDKVKERWIPDLEEEGKKYGEYNLPFDIVFARGGLPGYSPLYKYLKPGSFKIYYGAGKRFFPIPSLGWDLVLVDSPEQKSAIRKQLPQQKISPFIKPAADNIFYPREVEKEFDICVAFQLASYTKRFELAMQSIIWGGFSALVLGYVPNDVIHQVQQHSDKIHFGGRVPRTKVAEEYNRCRVGLAVHSQLESCPRVIPEFLASGLPIVVTQDTLFWKEKYINKETGHLCKPDKESIVLALNWILNNYQDFRPSEYYQKHLNLKMAAHYLENIINLALL